LKLTAGKDLVTTEVEPLFDAAELARMGKDIIVQHGFTANSAGIDWLQRHFSGHRFHAMKYSGDPYLIHIDCTFVPLRPGLLLNNPIRKAMPEQKKLFLKATGGKLLKLLSRPMRIPRPFATQASGCP